MNVEEKTVRTHLKKKKTVKKNKTTITLGICPNIYVPVPLVFTKNFNKTV